MQQDDARLRLDGELCIEVLRLLRRSLLVAMLVEACRSRTCIRERYVDLSGRQSSLPTSSRVTSVE
jgi:hypothetical protein